MSESNSTDNLSKGVAWALLASWLGAAFIVPWKLAAAHGPPHVLVVVMLAVGAVFSSAAAGVARRRAALRLDRLSIWVAVVLAVLTFTGNLASATAAGLISGPLLSVMLRTEVFVVAVLAWFLLGEKLDGGFVVGAFVAAFGLWVVNTPENVEIAADRWGLVCGVLAAASFAGMGVLTRKVIERIDVAWVNALRLWLSLALTLAAFGGGLSLGSTSGLAVAYAGIAAVLGPSLARLCLMHSARYMEARLTALVVLTSPVWTLLLCWVVLGDWPASHEILGGAIMLLGVAFALALRRVRGRRVSRNAASSASR